MTIFFALLASLANATSTITQHVASTANTKGITGWRFVRYLAKNPLWLFGWVALLGAFVFQAIALHNGLLSLVQTLLMTELVFALFLRRLWIRQAISAAAWASAGLTCVAVSVFIAVAEPRGGLATPTSGAWASSIAGCVVGAAVLALLGARGSPARRAGCLATAAAIVWALDATFIKAMTDTLTEDGIGGMFLHWPVYAVAASGIAGTLLVQVALHVGPLRVSQPLLVIVDPVVSIFLSVHLFDEHFTQDVGDLTIAAVAFVVMCVGIVLMTVTVPETMDRTPAPLDAP
ncbi:MAG TPA: DMT family transporter [Acidimicrobiales bacterium]|nr:DMT family transporter [Acidimicrobiales bacterium]